MVTDGIVKIHVHISFHWQGLNPNPLVNTCLQSLQLNSSRASLSELNVTVHVLFSASTRPTGQLDGREARGHVTSLRLVDYCWLLRLLARAGPWSPLSCTMGRCFVSLFTVCSTGSICVLDPKRVLELRPQRRCSCMWRWCVPLDWWDRDDRNEEISR